MNPELGYEARYDTEKPNAVVKTARYQLVKAIDSVGRPGSVGLHDEWPTARLESNAERFRCPRCGLIWAWHVTRIGLSRGALAPGQGRHSDRYNS